MARLSLLKIVACFVTLPSIFAGTTAAAVFLDPASYQIAAGPEILPPYASLAPLVFPAGTTDFYGYFDVVTESATGTPSNAAQLNTARNIVLDFESNGLQRVTLRFPQPVRGIAALWSNTFVEDGLRLTTPFGQYDLNQLVPNLNAQFIGVVETEPFSSVTFTTSTPAAGNDFVFFREFRFSPVPEPCAPVGWLAVVCGWFVSRKSAQSRRHGR